ncbi:MAG: hypothetical protein Q9163_005049 [Psora crenata]
MEFLQNALDIDKGSAFRLLLFIGFSALILSAWLSYIILYFVAPIPRPPLPSEKKYRSLEADGTVSGYKVLPCWQDKFNEERKAEEEANKRLGPARKKPIEIENAEVFMSLVVPAFNEEERLGAMLAEAVEYLEREYGDTDPAGPKLLDANGSVKERRKIIDPRDSNGQPVPSDQVVHSRGWEVLVVSDGSTDNTIDTALRFAKDLRNGKAAPNIRVIQLRENRGKGGAVTHGMRHARGQYAIFADADGASKFEDLGKLLRESKKIEDAHGRSVAVGSRAHLVGSEVVVKRSFLRNLLMHAFHLFLRLLTPPATAAIRDTQCGFKLFSRPSLPHIIPYMHSEGWIFDVEMLMLAESANIPVVEVPVGWKEVKGSKLNVLWDSLGMAWGLAVLRAAWGLGIYEQS